MPWRSNPSARVSVPIFASPGASRRCTCGRSRFRALLVFALSIATDYSLRGIVDALVDGFVAGIATILIALVATAIAYVDLPEAGRRGPAGFPAARSEHGRHQRRAGELRRAESPVRPLGDETGTAPARSRSSWCSPRSCSWSRSSIARMARHARDDSLRAMGAGAGHRRSRSSSRTTAAAGRATSRTSSPRRTAG